jgi:dTMP kinase
MFITFEGVDGSGKSTQVKLLAEAFRETGREVVVTREPGGTAGAEDIRSLLLGGEDDRWSSKSEALLFTAARRDHMEKLIWPALNRGAVVISDRFVDSTRVYQGMKSAKMRQTVDELHKMMIGFEASCTFILDIDPEVALKRSVERLAGLDVDEERFERRGLEFQQNLRAGFLDLSKSGPGRYKLIDASRDPKQVFENIRAYIDCLTPDIVMHDRSEPTMSL